VTRYRLNDPEHGRRMLSELRRRHPVKTAERADGTVQFFNNGQLAVVLAHWLRNRGREDREITVKLFGYHQPPHLPGKPKPRAKRDRCKLYDLRHAWALRAKATTTWSTAVKAASMGHSEAVHASRYLAEERAEHKLSHLLRRRALDEGQAMAPATGQTVPTPVSGLPPQAHAPAALPPGVTPDLIELARKLRAAGVA
jgi:integrase